MKKMFYALAFVALIGMVMAIGTVSAKEATGSEKITTPLSKISIGGGWSIQISGCTAYIRAPNGVQKTVSNCNRVTGQSTFAPYKAFCYYCNSGSGRWVYF